ncbi:LysR family transcriptional regulator, partial [Psychrobacter sanguinis]|nr:LysR family transcriptional regulator [Psychrobacter sanguinis]
LKDIVCIPMEHPIVWRVVLTRMQKESYSEIESYIMDSLVQSFLKE